MAVRELSSPPSMRVLYPKAVAGSGRAALRRLPGLGGGERELPDEELALPLVEAEREHLTAYANVCGFPLRDVLPPTYPHIVSFPLAMELMTRSDFPFPVIGLVHIANRIEQLRPIGADERFSVRVRTEALAPHDRGTQFQVVAEVEADRGAAWRSRSTYLHREGNGGSSRGDDRPEPPRPKAVWKLPGDSGRRYADVSGDRNPIHLHALSARLFGMPGMIAHGMWLKARCLAALESVIPESFEVDVRFKLPVLIPGRVSFASSATDGGRDFTLHDGNNEKPHLAGEARWSSS
ncbi:MAG TPA: MaoC/PaaZ C-terminal domain-containing protein [Thermoleophilaceae bacterium]